MVGRAPPQPPPVGTGGEVSGGASVGTGGEEGSPCCRNRGGRGGGGASQGLQPTMERLEAMAYKQTGPVIERIPIRALLDGWRYRLFRRDGPDREDVLAGLTRFPEAMSFANGTTFLAYGLPETVAPGGTLDVWLAWWVRSQSPPGTSYHFFARTPPFRWRSPF